MRSIKNNVQLVGRICLM